MVKPNEVYTYQKGVRIELNNTLPEEETKELATKIRHLLVRSKNGSKPWELQHLIDPEIGLANPNTIFNDFLFADNFGIYSKDGRQYIDFQLFETDSRT